MCLVFVCCTVAVNMVLMLVMTVNMELLGGMIVHTLWEAMLAMTVNMVLVLATNVNMALMLVISLMLVMSVKKVRIPSQNHPNPKVHWTSLNPSPRKQPQSPSQKHPNPKVYRMPRSPSNMSFPGCHRCVQRQKLLEQPSER